MERLLVLAVLLVGCADAGGFDAPPIEVADVSVPSEPDVAPPADDSHLVSGMEALDYVDPIIGTGGLGFAYAGMTPAVQTPLGFVKVGPDTTRGGTHPSEFHHFSGYYNEDPHIRGFSHTHFVGTGAADYGNLRIAVGNPQLMAERAPGRWFMGKVDGSEIAEPGYYSVDLEGGARAEMTARPWAAFHRYTLPDDHVLAFDLGSSVTDDGVQRAEVEVDGDIIEGYVVYAGGFIGRRQPFELRFSARVTPAPTTVRIWDGVEYHSGTNVNVFSPEAAVVLGWPEGDDRRVTVRVGISLVDGTQAREHREELDDIRFRQVREETRADWARELSRVRIPRDVGPQELTLFYTALYNCFRMPSRLDEDGRYRGLDGEVHEVSHRYFTDLSLWDTYRTLHPLWTLIAPELQRDVLRSLLLMKRDGGYIPRWPAAVSYTGAMEGDSGAILFAEGALKGIDGVDYDAAFDALVETADGPTPEGAAYGGRSGIDSYVELGWVAADRGGGSASNTLEYAIDDNALAELAAHLGRDDDAERYARRAKWYENVWDSETKFFRPRNFDGTFVEPFSKTKFHGRSGDYTEGTAWHWRFYVPHDPAGLVDLFGGADTFAAELETFMEKSKLWEGEPGLLALPDPYYWHTNQPPLHAPFLFAELGQWDRLEHWVDEIRQYAYLTTPDGLVGNDDGGTLSAWYVLASAGIYPVVSTDRWIRFRPAYEEIELEGVRTIKRGDEPIRGVVSHSTLVAE